MNIAVRCGGAAVSVALMFRVVDLLSMRVRTMKMMTRTTNAKRIRLSSSKTFGATAVKSLVTP